MNLTHAHATHENVLAAAAVRAITNADQWHTFDDNAVDSAFGSMEPIDSSDGEFDGVSIPLLITYRVSENNPFEVRA